MTSIESTESSSPIVTRAVAAGLRGEFCDNYEFPGWQKAVLTGTWRIAARRGALRHQPLPIHLRTATERAGRIFDG